MRHNCAFLQQKRDYPTEVEEKKLYCIVGFQRIYGFEAVYATGALCGVVQCLQINHHDDNFGALFTFFTSQSLTKQNNCATSTLPFCYCFRKSV